jgi:hypothetical protein
MSDRPTSSASQLGPAPADARSDARWPLWQSVVAYVVLACISAAAIWFIDLRAHRPPALPPPPDAAASSSDAAAAR